MNIKIPSFVKRAANNISTYYKDNFTTSPGLRRYLDYYKEVARRIQDDENGIKKVAPDERKRLENEFISMSNYADPKTRYYEYHMTKGMAELHMQFEGNKMLAAEGPNYVKGTELPWRFRNGFVVPVKRPVLGAAEAAELAESIRVQAAEGTDMGESTKAQETERAAGRVDGDMEPTPLLQSTADTGGGRRKSRGRKSRRRKYIKRKKTNQRR
jgi:hypothetical protein